MWCANCHADVAAEVTPDHRRVRCVSCGRQIGSAPSGRTVAKTQEARELLERWANERLLDPYGPVVQDASVQGGTSRENHSSDGSASSAATSPPNKAATGGRGSGRDRRSRLYKDGGDEGRPQTDSNPSQGDPDTKPPIRIDPPHPSTASAECVEEPSRTTGEDASPQPIPPTLAHEESGGAHSAGRQMQPEIESGTFSQKAVRLHAAHSPTPSGPHIDVKTANPPEPARQSNWMAFGGQLLAYVGIGGLTVGTTLVLWGYFGGPESYLPTGWLITTAGQMFLFLGILTLVSGGMEQTTEVVARRMDGLSERLIRLEQVMHGCQFSGSSSPSGGSDSDSPLPPAEETPSPKTEPGPPARGTSSIRSGG